VQVHQHRGDLPRAIHQGPLGQEQKSAESIEASDQPRRPTPGHDTGQDDSQRHGENAGYDYNEGKCRNAESGQEQRVAGGLAGELQRNNDGGSCGGSRGRPRVSCETEQLQNPNPACTYTPARSSPEATAAEKVKARST
jgi:hypothetical protein